MTVTAGAFQQSEEETKRYTLDYSPWLDTAELLKRVDFTVTPETQPPLEVVTSAILAGNTEIVFFVAGGVDRVTYTLEVIATTNGGQVKEDTLTIRVRGL